jgi:hypothetical protein
MAQLHTIDHDTNLVSVSSAQSRAKRSRLMFAFAALGAMSFWLPDLVIHLSAGPNLDSRHGLAITVCAPAVFLFAYVVARRFAKRQGFTWTGATMLLGVWLSGGLFMTIAAMVSGSEFIGGTGVWRLVAIFAGIVPIVTYVLSSYDGSVFALLAVTVGSLLICGVLTSCMLWNSGGTGSHTSLQEAQSHGDNKAA